MKRETLDFIQVNYAIDNRAAAERVIPLAADRGVAVMTNVPFGRDRLFKAVQGKELPAVAKDLGCTSWPQFFLKYVLGNPAVTCPIPAWRSLPMSRTTSPPPAERSRMRPSASRWRPSSMRSDRFTRRAAFALAAGLNPGGCGSGPRAGRCKEDPDRRDRGRQYRRHIGTLWSRTATR